MSLTGSVFLLSVIAVTVAAFVAVVVTWPRVAARGPGRIAARAGMLLGVNLLVLLTAATQLNAQFLFFADWTDLEGALGGGSHGDQRQPRGDPRGGGETRGCRDQGRGPAPPCRRYRPAA